MPIISGGGSGGSGGAISGVTVTGTAASGQVPVASSSTAGAWSYPPGYEIGYDQITGNVSVSSSTESAGTTVISAAAHTFDGGLVLVTLFLPVVAVGTGANAGLFPCLFESTTQITRFGGTLLSAQNQAATYLYRFTPTAGSHTYTVTCFNAVATGTIFCGAGGTGAYSPAFIRFTKV